ncbi:hypothetical protein LCGC14_1831980, partial [marine sediment metagenome]
MSEIIIEFENLTSEELHTLLEIEKKMKITGGERVGSGCYMPTRTRDWKIEVHSS